MQLAANVLGHLVPAPRQFVIFYAHRILDHCSEHLSDITMLYMISMRKVPRSFNAELGANVKIITPAAIHKRTPGGVGSRSPHSA